MKLLSIKQPWASLIASGRKTVELRTWSRDYRGPLIVCAGVGPRRGTNYEIGPLGVAICLVELTDIRPTQPGDDVLACCSVSSRELAWVLRVLRQLPPVPIKGQLGLWDASSELRSTLGV